MSEEKQMDSSPTGLPVIPPRYVPWLVVLYVGLAAASEVVPDGSTWEKGLHVILAVGAGLGLVSPGWRKKP